jgi:hypothetical protein
MKRTITKFFFLCGLFLSELMKLNVFIFFKFQKNMQRENHMREEEKQLICFRPKIEQPLSTNRTGQI